MSLVEGKSNRDLSSELLEPDVMAPASQFEIGARGPSAQARPQSLQARLPRGGEPYWSQGETRASYRRRRLISINVKRDARDNISPE
jgi:hypothetical protein